MQLNPPSMKELSAIYFLANSGSMQPLSFQVVHPWEKVAYLIAAFIWIPHLGSEGVWAVDILSPYLG